MDSHRTPGQLMVDVVRPLLVEDGVYVTLDAKASGLETHRLQVGDGR